MNVRALLLSALVLLGGNVSARNFTLDADIVARVDMGGGFPLNNTENDLFFSADNYLFNASAGDALENYPSFEKCTGGITTSYYPLKSLRLQATVAYNTMLKGFSGGLGLTYCPHFHYEK